MDTFDIQTLRMTNNIDNLLMPLAEKSGILALGPLHKKNTKTSQSLLGYLDEK